MDINLENLCRGTNVRVLNLDELYKIIKPEISLEVGQRIDVELKESNKDYNDAIGYYRGIMVVVKNGGPFAGQINKACGHYRIVKKRPHPLCQDLQSR